MAESNPEDSISKLHELTLGFTNQVREIMVQCLIECSKIDNFDNLSANPQVQEVCSFFSFPYE